MPDPTDFQDIQGDLANPIGTLFDAIPEAEIDDQELGSGIKLFDEQDTEPQPEKKEPDEEEKKPEPGKKPEESETTAETTAKEEGQEEIEIDEEPLVDSFVSALEAKWDWEIPEDKRPKTYDEFVKFFENVVEESSKPVYASDDVKAFDEYVKAGGTKAGFFETYERQLQLDNLDPKNEQHQEDVLLEYYKIKGFSEEKAKRYLDRVKAGDEAEQETIDAIEELKIVRKQEHEANLRAQKEAEQQREAQTQQFVAEVSGTLKSIQNVFGIEVSTRERAELESYVFDIGKDGKTQQQRDFEENPVLYTIMTGFAFKNRDKLLTKLENKATTTASLRHKERLQELANKGKTKSSTTIPAGDNVSFLDMFGKE